MSLTGDERFPGSYKGIVSLNYAVFLFSDLKDAHEVKSANLIGVMMIAYNNTNLFYE